jgi:hypothetical protein
VGGTPSQCPEFNVKRLLIMSKKKDNEEDSKILVDRLEYERLKLALSSMPSELGYWVDHVGSGMRIVRRDFHEYYGKFLGFTCEIKELELGVIDEVRDYVKNTIRSETKVIRLPITAMTNLEWIIESEEKPVAQPQPVETSK